MLILGAILESSNFSKRKLNFEILKIPKSAMSPVNKERLSTKTGSEQETQERLTPRNHHGVLEWPRFLYAKTCQNKSAPIISKRKLEFLIDKRSLLMRLSFY